MEFRRRLNLSSLAQNSTAFCETPWRRAIHSEFVVSAEPRANSMNRLFPYEARTFCIFNERIARVQTVASSFLVSSQTSLRVLSIVSTFRTRSGIIDDRSTLLPIRPRFFLSFFFFFFFSYFRRRSLRSIDRIDDKFSPRPITSLLRYPRLTSSFSRNVVDGDKRGY